ncbi:hypothetical protein ACTXT7_008074 [Hymenolepis weldensis]
MSSIARAIASIRKDLVLWGCLLTLCRLRCAPPHTHLEIFGKMSRIDFSEFSSIMSCTLLTSLGVLNTITQRVFSFR